MRGTLETLHEANDRLEDARTTEITEEEARRLIAGTDGLIGRFKAFWKAPHKTGGNGRLFYRFNWDAEEVLVMKTKDGRYLKFHDEREFRRVATKFSLYQSKVGAEAARVVMGG